MTNFKRGKINFDHMISLSIYPRVKSRFSQKPRFRWPCLLRSWYSRWLYYYRLTSYCSYTGKMKTAAYWISACRIVFCAAIIRKSANLFFSFSSMLNIHPVCPRRKKKHDKKNRAISRTLTLYVRPGSTRFSPISESTESWQRGRRLTFLFLYPRKLIHSCIHVCICT